MAPAPSTIPSYTSLLSGTFQNTHGVYDNYDKADPSIVMLAERLREAGYATAAVLEGTFPGSFANVGQGFDWLTQRGDRGAGAVALRPRPRIGRPQRPRAGDDARAAAAAARPAPSG